MLKALIIVLTFFFVSPVYAGPAGVEGKYKDPEVAAPLGMCGFVTIDVSDLAHQQCLKEMYFGQLMGAFISRLPRNHGLAPAVDFGIREGWDIAEKMVRKRNLEVLKEYEPANAP